jgi:hypothetical protein
MGQERPVVAIDGIRQRRRNPRDVLVGSRALARLPIVHVRGLPAGIGAHATKVAAGSQVLVGDTGWDDDDITAAYLEDGPVFAAELHPGRTAIDSQDFVGRAVIVVGAVYAIPPGVTPPVLSE